MQCKVEYRYVLLAYSNVHFTELLSNVHCAILLTILRVSTQVMIDSLLGQMYSKIGPFEYCPFRKAEPASNREEKTPLTSGRR